MNAGGGFLPHFMFFLAFLQVLFFISLESQNLNKVLEKETVKTRTCLKIRMARGLFCIPPPYLSAFSHCILTY